MYYPKKPIFVLLFCCFCYLSNATPTSSPKENAVELLAKVHFCQEALPLHQPSVARQFALTVRRFNRRFVRNIRSKATQHFDIIEPILKKHNIPTDFKYLALIESRFEAHAMSAKGAHGYWQFMPATARAMGLTVNKNTDERRDLRKSTVAACKYLNQLYRKFGSWTIVAAAYNAGPGQASVYMNRRKDYYAWNSTVETRQYVYRIVAVKEWFHDPEQLNAIVELLHDKNEMYRLATLVKASAHKSTEIQQPDFSRPALIVKSPPLIIDTSARIATALPKSQPKPMFSLKSALKTELKEGGSTQKGQSWTFEVTEAADMSGTLINAQDRLYAVVESYDSKNKIIVLKVEQMYSPKQHKIYSLSLTSIEATQVGIHWPNKSSVVHWTKLPPQTQLAYSR